MEKLSPESIIREAIVNDCKATLPLLSVARKSTLKEPISPGAGCQTTRPVAGLTAMPAGATGRSKVTVSPSESPASGRLFSGILCDDKTCVNCLVAFQTCVNCLVASPD